MPSTHRTQVLLPDHIQVRVQGLAGRSKRSLSAMCCELIEYALEHGDQYQVADDTKSSRVQALIDGADLSDVRMQKLLKLLDALE